MRNRHSRVCMLVPILAACVVVSSAWAQTPPRAMQSPGVDPQEAASDATEKTDSRPSGKPLDAKLARVTNASSHSSRESEAAQVYPSRQSEGTMVGGSGLDAPSTGSLAADLLGPDGACTVDTPFVMIGDISPLIARPFSGRASLGLAHTDAFPSPPKPPGPRGATPVLGSVRLYKLSEDQSPRPQDRVFFDFHYYTNLDNSINRRDLTPVTQMQAYVYNFGVEKTFNDGKGSIGIRLPLDNLTANSYGDVVNTPTSTALGDLSIFAKYIVKQDVRTGSLISALFAITPESGAGRFAGAPYLFGINSTYIQPCIAYIYNHDRWYLQGFSGFNVATNPNDVSIIFNDVGIGYYLHRNRDPRAFLTALAPTFELHVNNPVSHRDWTNSSDLAAMPDIVDLTFGLNLAFRDTAVLTAAFVTPVSSPKPFDSEAILMLNVYFGRTRANTARITPPPAD